jgi:ribonuclease P protein component
VPARHGFPKRNHLRKTDEISSVFGFRCWVGGNFLVGLAKPNELGYPRLAVIVARKISRQAVARNYIRRSIRELFRREQDEIGPLDIVIRATRSFSPAELMVVREELLAHFSSLKKCLRSSSFSSAAINT